MESRHSTNFQRFFEPFSWGMVYSGLVTNCNEVIRPVHNGVPVLLLLEDYDRWLNGSAEDAVALNERCFPDNLIEVTRTDELWVKRKPAVADPARLL